MKKIAILLIALGVALSASAQQTIESGRMEDFSRIDLTGNLVVELIKADADRVEIKLNGTNSTRLQWGVKSGALAVNLRPGGEKGANGEVKIYYRQLNDLRVSEANVSVKGVLAQGMLDVDLSNGAILGGDFDMKDLSVKLSGNSAANLNGKVKYFTLVASGKSKANARMLIAQDARVESTSNAEVYVNAVERLQIVANTAGAVYYQGEPEIFRSATKLMGTVNNIGK